MYNPKQRMKLIVTVLIAASLTASASDRFAALSQLETGDCDACVGAAGEISRYQITVTEWKAHTKLPESAATNPFTARQVAAQIQDERCVRFITIKHRQPTDVEWELLWNRPATQLGGRNPTAKEIDRANRFNNLCRVNIDGAIPRRQTK